MVNQATKELMLEIDQTIMSYKEKAAKNRNYAVTNQLITAGLGVSTTIIIGLNFNDLSSILNTIALVLSGLVTFNQAIAALFNYRDFWVEFNEKSNDLRKLKFDIKMEESLRGALTEEKFLEFKGRFQSIVDTLNSFWRFNRSKKEKVDATD